MDVLPISDGHGRLLMLAPFYLLAVMLYPLDQAARARFVTAVRGRLVAGWKARGEAMPIGDWLLAQSARQSFEDVYRMARERSPEIAPWYGLANSGEILRRVMRFKTTDPKRASLRQAMLDISDARDMWKVAGSIGDQPLDRLTVDLPTLWEVWRDWKSVAHLTATWCVFRSDLWAQRQRGIDASLLNPFDLHMLPNFLRWGENFRKAGETHFPPGAKGRFGRPPRPTLDPDLTWKLPPDLDLDAEEVVVVPFLPLS